MRSTQYASDNPLCVRECEEIWTPAGKNDGHRNILSCYNGSIKSTEYLSNSATSGLSIYKNGNEVVGGQSTTKFYEFQYRDNLPGFEYFPRFEFA